jgi:hypothetical protein
MVEPAFGIGGALTALQSNPSEFGPKGGDSGDLRAAAGELSRAAQGLEASRGNISGQTMAINQMAQAQDQRMREISSGLGQLQNSIATLANSINRMASSVGMMGSAASQQSMGTPAAMMGGMGGMGGAPIPSAEQLNSQRFGPIGAMARGAMGAAGMVGRGLGGMAGAAASPFMGAGFQGAAPGQMAGQFTNAGGMRSFMHGTGIPFQNSSLRQSGSGEITQLASERAGFRAGGMMLAGGAGMAELGMGLGGGALGGAVGGAALGGMTGGPVGAAIGTGLGAMVGDTMGGRMAQMVTRPMLRQAGQIRGGGELAGRQAFRFMDPSQLQGAAATPNFRTRQRMGSSMMQEGISDLTFGQEDMQEMFSGMVEQDTMRGANNMQEVSRIFRMNKEAIKNIGRSMKTTISESAEVLGELQSLGVDTRGTSSVIAGSGVRGLTRPEALRGQMAFAGEFQGSGLQGSGLMGLGALSQGMGQSAIATGALGAEQIAAVGGRAGAQQVTGQGVAQLLQGPMGMSMMAAGMQGGQFNMQSALGKSQLGIMQQAGGRATAGNLAALTANPQKYMREAMEDPEGLTVQLMRQVTSTAKDIQRGAPGISMDDAVMHVLRSQGMDAPQADAFLQSYKAMPKAMKDKSRENTRAMNEMIESQAMENISVTGRVSRFGQRLISPLSTSATEGAAGVQEQVSNLSKDVKDRVLGLRRVGISAEDVNTANLDTVLSRAELSIPSDRKSVHGAKPTPEKKAAANAKIRKALAAKGDYRKLHALRDETDPGKRKKLAKEIMSDLAGDMYGSDDPEIKKALEDAVTEATGENVSQHLSGIESPVSEEQLKEYGESQDEMRRLLTEGVTGQVLGAAPGAAMVTAGAAISSAGMMTPFAGVASILGTGISAVGAFLGKEGMEMGEMGDFSAEEMAQMTKDPDVAKMISLKKKKAGAGLTDAEKMEMQKIEAKKPELANRLDRMSPEDLSSMDKHMSASRKKAGGVAVMKATEAAASKMSAALEGIGSDSAAGQLAASADSPLNFVKTLGEMQLSDEDMEKLRDEGGAGGQQLIRAIGISQSRSKDDLRRIMSEEDIKKLNLAEGPIDPKKAAEIAALDAMETNAADGVVLEGGRGYTSEQKRQQAEMLGNVTANTHVLKQLDATLKDLQKLPALRR